MDLNTIEELHARLRFAAKQSTTRGQMKPPDGCVGKTELEIVAGVVGVILEDLKRTAQAPPPETAQATPTKTK